MTDSDSAFRIEDVAKHCRVEVAVIEAAIKAGAVPRYGAGVGKVTVHDVVGALGPEICPTCRQKIPGYEGVNE